MSTTFIIVSYNTCDLILSCLKSLAKFEKNSQVIVVDNNSQDHSAKAIKTHFPKVNLILSDQNLGFARANNLGIKQANSDFIILLNSDTELESPISPQLTMTY